MEKGFNPRNCRLLGWSTLFMAIFGVVLYWIVGVIDVPSASPLADPNFVIRELNDPTIPWDTELPPGTVTPINMLNNGQPIITPPLALGILAFVVCMIFSLKFKDWATALSASTLCEFNLARFIIQTLADIIFEYHSLRAGAQPLIEDSHRLRVIVAYLQLGCERFDILETWRLALMIFSIVMIISYALAGILEYRHQKREKELTS